MTEDRKAHSYFNFYLSHKRRPNEEYFPLTSQKKTTTKRHFSRGSREVCAQIRVRKMGFNGMYGHLLVAIWTPLISRWTYLDQISHSCRIKKRKENSIKNWIRTASLVSIPNAFGIFLQCIHYNTINQLINLLPGSTAIITTYHQNAIKLEKIFRIPQDSINRINYKRCDRW